MAPAQLQQLRVRGAAVAIGPAATHVSGQRQRSPDRSHLSAGVDATGAQYLQAYCGRVQSTVSRVGNVDDSIRNAAQDYQTEVGNKQGNRINQLTIVSILFLRSLSLPGISG